MKICWIVINCGAVVQQWAEWGSVGQQQQWYKYPGPDRSRHQFHSCLVFVHLKRKKVTTSFNHPDYESLLLTVKMRAFQVRATHSLTTPSMWARKLVHIIGYAFVKQQFSYKIRENVWKIVKFEIHIYSIIYIFSNVKKSN